MAGSRRRRSGAESKPNRGRAAWAADLAERLLKPLGRRWRHTLGVAAVARQVGGLLEPHEAQVLIAAAYLHDIGYAPDLHDTGFHPVDGARFLRRHGHEQLANLVAHHTGARFEAQELGLERELSEFDEERSALAKLLSYCDLTTSPEGESVLAAARLAEIIDRYGDSPPARAMRRASPQLLAQAAEVGELLSTNVRHVRVR